MNDGPITGPMIFRAVVGVITRSAGVIAHIRGHPHVATLPIEIIVLRLKKKNENGEQMVKNLISVIYNGASRDSRVRNKDKSEK